VPDRGLRITIRYGMVGTLDILADQVWRTLLPDLMKVSPGGTVGPGRHRQEALGLLSERASERASERERERAREREREREFD
jgi:hypothetical protein